ncbi:MAG: hypothetical protein EXS08_05380 [Planctomycetes bacterium]|nr:hypothetical protein [Planctomycetota bacterium]
MMLPLLSVLLAAAPGGDLVAIRVKRAETVAHGVIEHALILVEDGKIIEIGEDLPVERGIPVLERPDWVATPGLIDAHTRIGLDRAPGRAFEPQARPNVEIDPKSENWAELLELGVTTLGIYPDGSGIPGQAIVLQPHGDTLAEMLVAEPAYLKIFLQSNASSKKALRDAFQKVDEYQDKVTKEREKWDKEQEKKKKPAKAPAKKEDEKKEEPPKEEKKAGTAAESALGQDDKKDDKKDEKKSEASGFVPPVPDEKVKPFFDLRQKTLTAMMSIRKAADYLHLLDVIEGEKDMQWFLQFGLFDDIDMYEVVAKIGEKKLLVVTVPEITLQTNSLRERNIPAELVKAGARLALLPRSDSMAGFKDWLPDVGRLIGQGLSREAALSAVTLEPARALGLEKRLGSLEKDKDANIVFWSGDPFEPSSKVEAVMLGGEFVVGDVK